jgi:hypothetical protein
MNNLKTFTEFLNEGVERNKQNKLNESVEFQKGSTVKDKQYGTVYKIADILPLTKAFDFVTKKDEYQAEMDLNDWLIDYGNDDLFYVLEIVKLAPKDHDYEGLTYVMFSVNNDGDRTLKA